MHELFTFLSRFYTRARAHKMPFCFASELDIARWYDFTNYERIISECLFYYNHKVYFKIQTGFLNLTFVHVPLLSLSKIHRNKRIVAKTISDSLETTESVKNEMG